MVNYMVCRKQLLWKEHRAVSCLCSGSLKRTGRCNPTCESEELSCRANVPEKKSQNVLMGFQNRKNSHTHTFDVVHLFLQLHLQLEETQVRGQGGDWEKHVSFSFVFSVDVKILETIENTEGIRLCTSEWRTYTSHNPLGIIPLNNFR